MIKINGNIVSKNGEKLIEINYKNLINTSLPHNSVENNEQPSFGIYSNRGSVDILDPTEKIKEYAQNKKLDGAIATFYLENTFSQSKQQIAEYFVESWDYDIESLTISITMTDGFELWQEISNNGFDLPISSTGASVVKQEYPAKTLYEELYKNTPKSFKLLSFEELDDETKLRLLLTPIPFLYLEKGTLWEQWTKLCFLTGSKIYRDFSGQTIFAIEV